MDIQKIAAEYIARGWQVVPLSPGSKACKSSDWLKLVFTPDMFEAGDNLGIRSVDGIVDIDCDSEEVVLAAPHFLPPTTAIYGRKSKPAAHYLYRSQFEKTVALKDLGGDDKQKTSLIEIRVNHQSMAPPSIHPSGEVLTWAGDGSLPSEAAAVEPKVLLWAVRLTATAALVARYYGPKGGRHDWALALSGFFRSVGLAESEAASVFRVAGLQVGETDAQDRANAVRGTYAKAEDEAVSGATRLSEIMGLTGKTFVASIRKIWGAESAGVSETALQKMNEKHAVIFQQSGELVVITEDLDNGRPYLRYSSLATIRELYPELITVGVKANGEPITKPLGKAWLESPRRRKYNGITLSPGNKAPEDHYNLWRGFSVEPKKGSWTKFRNHIKDVICCNEPELISYVISWMARAVQEPGKPASSSIALRGGQGTGKSTFAKWFGALFGSHFLHLDSTRQLTGNFNAHLHNAILVFADEAAWPGDKAGLGALRRMVTEDTLSIERKGMDVLTVPNLIHLLLASNEEWVVPAAFDERRFAVIDVAAHRQNDRKYFAEIQAELFEEGGLAAMLYDLLEVDISTFLQIPKTEALLKQKQLTSEPRLQWWFDVLNDGAPIWLKRNESPAYPGEYEIEREGLYDSYISAMDKARTRTYGHSFKVAFGKFLGSMLPEGYPRSIRPAGENRKWVFPDLETCRAMYESRMGAKNLKNVWETVEESRPAKKIDF